MDSIYDNLLLVANSNIEDDMIRISLGRWLSMTHDERASAGNSGAFYIAIDDLSMGDEHEATLQREYQRDRDEEEAQFGLAARKRGDES